MYKKSILGGTFDNFHLGHQKLIDTAFNSSECVAIGITLPEMYKNKFLSEAIQNYEVRKENIKKYLYEKNYLNRAQIIAINNIFGNTLEEKDIDVIFATEENIKNVELINSKRKEINFPELKIIIVPYVNDDNGWKITSERIRKGEINSDGFVYKNIFADKTLIMPESLRDELQKPLNKIYNNIKDILPILNNKIIISVGDIVTSELKKSGINPAVSIIDFKTRRHELPILEIKNSIKTKNEHGTINYEAVNTFLSSLEQYIKTKDNQTVIVKGEEDLLALPAIVLAPLGLIVLYGQFDQGVVLNEVKSELKNHIVKLLKKFE